MDYPDLAALFPVPSYPDHYSPQVRGEQLSRILAALRMRLDPANRAPAPTPALTLDPATAAERKKTASANERMPGELMRNPESLEWGLRTWADFCKCSEGNVQKTAAWKRIMLARAEAKAGRTLSARRPR